MASQQQEFEALSSKVSQLRSAAEQAAEEVVRTAAARDAAAADVRRVEQRAAAAESTLAAMQAQAAARSHSFDRQLEELRLATTGQSSELETARAELARAREQVRMGVAPPQCSSISSTVALTSLYCIRFLQAYITRHILPDLHSRGKRSIAAALTLRGDSSWYMRTGGGDACRV
jgi:hypothetical protein